MRDDDEPVAPLHPAAGRDLAADGGDPAGRACVAYQFLPLSALPEVDYPTIQVQTFYPGASPEVMTSSVTAPLEAQFGQMPGLNQMSSTQLGRRLGHHAAVRSRASASTSPSRKCRRRSTPPATCCRTDLPAPPIYAKVNPGRRAGPDAGAHLEDPAADRRSRIWPTPAWRRRSRSSPGVGLVSISGGQRPAVRIQANLAGAGRLRPQHRRSAHHHRQRQRQHAQGQLRRRRRAPTRSTPTTSSQSADDYASIIVAYKNGAPVRLSDVATVGRQRREQQARRAG